MEAQTNPDIATGNLVFAKVESPSQLYQRTTDEVYTHLAVTADKREEITQCAKSIYKESTFPDVCFADIPITVRIPAARKLRESLKKIDRNCGQSWFVTWALWWEHTEPIKAPEQPLSQRKADDIYTLLRVNAPMRLEILNCTTTVYTRANFQDVRFNKLDRGKVRDAESQLATELRNVFPDIRRGEPWFSEWALWRRHKTRPESRKRGVSRVKSGDGGGIFELKNIVNWSEADDDDDTN